MSEEVNLQPCPFCGMAVEDIVDATKILGVWNFIHRCRVVGAIKIERSSRELVANDWNSRPIESALRARVAELEAERDRLSSEVQRLASRMLAIEYAGHSEDCGGLDEPAQRCACGWLQREYVAEGIRGIERRNAELEREVAELRAGQYDDGHGGSSEFPRIL